MRSTITCLALLASCMLASSQPVFAGEKEDRLATAVRSRDHEAVKQLLGSGARPNVTLADHSVPLAWAIDRQDLDTVRMLLAAGADPNATDFYGNPLLMSACELGNEDVILAMVSAGADVKASRADGITALALCSGSSTPQAIKTLVEKGADPNVADKAGQTPLMRAAAAGAVDNMGILMTMGANMDASTPRGATALFFALQSGDAQAPAMMLDAGAKTGGLTPEGQTIIEASLASHNEAFADDVMKRGASLSDRNKQGWQLIHTLSAGGYTELVKTAILLGADPNSLTLPPVEQQKVEVAANSNAGIADRKNADKDGGARKDPKLAFEKLTAPPPPSPRSSLMLAAAGGHIETMKALVAAGARPKDRAPDGMTVTLAAVSSGDLPTVSYALELDPDITATAQGGRTALHIAIRATNTEGAEALIPFLAEKGVKLDAQDEQGRTAGQIVNLVGPPNLRAAYNKLLKERGLPIPERKFPFN